MNDIIRNFLFLGVFISFASTAAPVLESVQVDKPGILLVKVDWGSMNFDDFRGQNIIKCKDEDCMGQPIGLIANINGHDEEFPRFTTRLISKEPNEMEVISLLTRASRNEGKSYYRIPLPVKSDLCFKYSLGYEFDIYAFSKPNCISESLLKVTPSS